MRRSVALSLTLLGLAACAATPAVPETAPPSTDGQIGSAVVVEVISLPHAPIRPYVSAVTDLVENYGERLTLVMYDFDSDDGTAFAEQMGITEHTALAVFIDRESEFDVDGRTVRFLNFPVGAENDMVEDGEWSIDDLRAVLDRLTS